MLKMQTLAENLASAGQPLSDEDLILYILGGLGHEYDSVVVNLTSRHDQLTIQEVQFMLQSQEMRLEHLNTPTLSDLSNPSAHLATQIQRGLHLQNSTKQLSPSSGRCSYHGHGRGRGVHGNRPWCQLCGRVGHFVTKCSHRFDVNFQGPSNTSNISHPNNPPSFGQQFNINNNNNNN